LRAAVLDGLIGEFAPMSGGPASSWIGSRRIEVDRFYVAWSPAQLEGIVDKVGGDGGAYVAYLGAVGEKARALLARSLSPHKGLIVRFVGETWRYHSWGVAERIARALGVDDPIPVRVMGKEADLKVTTFLPAADLPKVREAVFASGGGRYGLYSRCSFAAAGRGTFYGERGSKPVVGEAGKLEELDEQRLEVKVPQEKLGRVISALRKAHPYEEPVIETYETMSGTEFGEGRMGDLGGALTPQAASRRAASVLRSQPVLSLGREAAESVLIWDGEPADGLHEASVSAVGLYVGPDSKGLARVMARASDVAVLEFPRYCFLLAGARELVYLVRETSKREGWGLRTYLPTRVGGEGVRR